MIVKLFIWLRDLLGLELDRTQSEWQYRQLEAKLLEIQDQLAAMKAEKPQVSAPKPNGKARVMDYETSQIATLDEFKES